MNFVICNREQARKEIPQVPYLRISITDEDKGFVYVNEDKEYLLHSLRLKFWDTDSNDFPDRSAISKEQADKIIDVMEKYKEVAWVVIVNCEGGLSRSPAVAAALSKIYEGTDAEIVRSKPFYNKYVYRTILNAYEDKVDKILPF